MKTRCFLVVLAAGIGAVALHGADFWQKKKYPEWSQKEVRKMLADSPWARAVAIPMGSGSSRGGGGRGGRGGRNMDTPTIDASDSIDPGVGRRSPGRAGGGMESGGAMPGLEVIVRWHTALPVKQAVVRARFGDEVEKSAEAQKLLGREETRYVVGVIGLPPSVLRGDPAALKERVLLRVKDQPPIRAEGITGDPQENRINLYIFFPKGQNGSHVIALDDRDVELVVPLGAVEVRRKFRLKDMVYDGKLEL